MHNKEPARVADRLIAEAARATDPAARVSAFFAVGLAMCEAEGERLRSLGENADQAIELDNAAWQAARLRCYPDSKDELAFVRAFKLGARVARPTELDDDSFAARAGFRAGLRYAGLMNDEEPGYKTCPRCGGELWLEDDERARPYRCPECDSAGRVPLTPEDEAELRIGFQRGNWL